MRMSAAMQSACQGPMIALLSRLADLGGTTTIPEGAQIA